MNGNKATLLLLILLILTPPTISRADWFDDTFIDPTDHMLDTSNWLLEKKGFLPFQLSSQNLPSATAGDWPLFTFTTNWGQKKEVHPAFPELLPEEQKTEPGLPVVVTWGSGEMTPSVIKGD